MATFQIKCIDGCGTVLGKVVLPDGVPYPGDAHYGFMVPAHHETRRAAEAQAEADRAAAKQAADDAALNAKIAAEVRRQLLP